MKTLYIDCINGAAGDMLLGALLDAGASVEEVREALESLDLPGWNLTVERTARRGIAATKIDVEVANDVPARRYSEIVEILEGSGLAPRVKERALSAFEVLGRAEAKVHGVGLDEVHLHEAGAIDAIVDIVGVCAAVTDLGSERIVVSPVPTGRGFIEAAHGTIPLPAPAVTEILRGAPMFERGSEELITPTGAALLVSLSDSFGPIPGMRIAATGYGAGTRDGAIPNLVRVLVGESVAEGAGGHVLLEWNLDDMNPEIVPYAIDRIISAGALDAWAQPIVMKKGRPALLMAALTTRETLEPVLDSIYSETTTLGVRIRSVERSEVQREWRTVEVEGHPLRIKLGLRDGVVVNAAPEYEDAAKVARVTGLPLKEVYRRALADPELS